MEPRHFLSEMGEAVLVLVLTSLLVSCSNMSIPDKLVTAASRGDISSLRRVLSFGDNINSTNRWGYTPLMAAVEGSTTRRQGLDTVSWLLTKGASLSPRNVYGYDALDMAVSSGADSAALLLLNAGADANDRNSVDGNTSLHYAAAVGSAVAVGWLLAAGAKVNLANKTGDTPLHLAVPRDLALVKLLLKAGADPNVCDIYGITPLSRAVASTNYKSADYAEKLRLLLDHGADPFLVCPSSVPPPDSTVGWRSEGHSWVGMSAIDVAKNLNRTSALELLTRYPSPSAVKLRKADSR
jgi:ankyrin repeat protein